MTSFKITRKAAKLFEYVVTEFFLDGDKAGTVETTKVRIKKTQKVTPYETVENGEAVQSLEDDFKAFYTQWEQVRINNALTKLTEVEFRKLLGVVEPQQGFNFATEKWR